MGVDQTDPIEQIAAGQITLTDNVQVREMVACTPDQIRQRVRRIIAEAGPNRLVVSTTGTPLGPIGPRLAENYRALIGTALEWGRP
ncbi:MAG: hypothetical protein IT426_07105 [Pirellulales bacterium]|nr:hypothetical protein [Pirellulales bacterium]